MDLPRLFLYSINDINVFLVGGNKMKNVLILSGHGGTPYDPGAIGSGEKEAVLTRELALMVQEELKKVQDINPILYDQNNDAYKVLKNGGSLPLDNIDYVFEIHFNASANDSSGDGKTTGTEVLMHSTENDTSLGNAICKRMSDLGFTNRGVQRRDGLLVMNTVKKKYGISHALLETCFIDDIDDMDLYRSQKDKVVKAVVGGIAEGFGLKYNDTTENPTPPPTNETVINPTPVKSSNNKKEYKYDSAEPSSGSKNALAKLTDANGTSGSESQKHPEIPKKPLTDANGTSGTESAPYPPAKPEEPPYVRPDLGLDDSHGTSGSESQKHPLTDKNGASGSESQKRPNMTNTPIEDIIKYLDKAGYPISSDHKDGLYDQAVENIVKKFQKDNGLTEDGITNQDLLDKIVEKANENANDVIEEEAPIDEIKIEEDPEFNAHYDSYFNTNASKVARLNHKDIKIVFGNSSITKTIKDVFMRSVSVEVDTSGNPISEVYEFIARDVIESDEATDEDKYEEYNGLAASDYKYYSKDASIPTSSDENQILSKTGVPVIEAWRNNSDYN